MFKLNDYEGNYRLTLYKKYLTLYEAIPTYIEPEEEILPNRCGKIYQAFQLFPTMPVVLKLDK